jgi:hypothetical protein
MDVSCTVTKLVLRCVEGAGNHGTRKCTKTPAAPAKEIMLQRVNNALSTLNSLKTQKENHLLFQRLMARIS